jgi:hypothetical protein
MYEMREESGRMSARLKALQLAEQDMADYGAIERTDEALEERARYHVAQMQAQFPTPQAMLTDDTDALTGLIVEQYAIAYRGLLVAYTGLREPFRLALTPRYTTSAAFDDSGVECDFTGLSGLRAIIQEEQAILRQNAEIDGCRAEDYLRTFVQVTICDARQASADMPGCFICYDLEGSEITGVYVREGVSDEILCGLGLPSEKDFLQEGKVVVGNAHRKDNLAFGQGEGPCYWVGEVSYTRADFVQATNGEEVIAERLFALISGQDPLSAFYELARAGARLLPNYDSEEERSVILYSAEKPVLSTDAHLQLLKKHGWEAPSSSLPRPRIWAKQLPGVPVPRGIAFTDLRERYNGCAVKQEERQGDE